MDLDISNNNNELLTYITELLKKISLNISKHCFAVSIGVKN